MNRELNSKRTYKTMLTCRSVQQSTYPRGTLKEIVNQMLDDLRQSLLSMPRDSVASLVIQMEVGEVNLSQKLPTKMPLSTEELSTKSTTSAVSAEKAVPVVSEEECGWSCECAGRCQRYGTYY